MENGLRICHIVPRLCSDMGGLPRSVAGMACAQASAGLQVSVLYQGPENPGGWIRRELETMPGFRQVNWVDMPMGKAEFFLARRTLDTLASFRPQVVQTHGLWEPLLRMSHGWCIREKVPFVITPHGMLHPWQAKHRKIRKWILRRLLGWDTAWAHAAAIQALDPNEAGQWDWLDGPDVRVIPNGVPAVELEEQEDPAPSFESPYVLFLGRLHAQKGPDRLLSVCKQLSSRFPDVQWVLAGPDGGMRTRLENRIKDEGMEESMSFVGWVDKTRATRLLKHAACYVQPSRSEGFSLSLLEAASAGAPCVISPTCGFEDLVEAGGARVAETQAEWVEAVGELLQYPERAEAMGQTAKKRIGDSYTWSRVADQQLDLYRSVEGSA